MEEPKQESISSTSLEQPRLPDPIAKTAGRDAQPRITVKSEDPVESEAQLQAQGIHAEEDSIARLLDDLGCESVDEVREELSVWEAKAKKMKGLKAEMFIEMVAQARELFDLENKVRVHKSALVNLGTEANVPVLEGMFSLRTTCSSFVLGSHTIITNEYHYHY